MTEAKPKKKRRTVATTRSTGGAGFAFEDLVAADLLSKMLLDQPVDGIGAPGVALLSQAAAAGWQIDDLVCIGRGPGSAEHRLALSCKSNVQVTASGWPEDFAKAAWALWRKQDPFNRATDAVALVTRGRNVAFDRVWSDLKQWCVGAEPGLALARIDASLTHRRVFDSIRDPGMEQGRKPTDEETLALVSALEIYPLDFQLSPSTSLADARSRCRSALRSESASEADKLWEALVKAAATARLGNGTIRLAELLRGLAQRFALKAHPSIAGSWRRLEALSDDHRSSIESALPNGHVVERRAEGDGLAEALDQGRGCVVVGDSGAGKSALVRHTLDARFSDAAQIWLGPEALGDALSAARRHAIGLDHDLAFIAERSPGPDKLLVLDSIERLDAATLVKLDALLRTLAAEPSWRVVLVTQLSGFEGQTASIAAARDWPRIPVPALSSRDVRQALHSVPALRWISGDSNILPLLANLRTLGWVIAAESSFHQADSPALTSAAAIADRLWERWTGGPASAQLRRLLVRLAVREANFERSFRMSELESGDLAAFDQRSEELPLEADSRNRIEFRHDLAADWARYQRLKEIADDVPQWSALSRQPLWMGALRLFGQFLLAQPDQARDGWNSAFAAVTAAGNVEAGDLLLDALCLDPQLDRHLADRAELMFGDDGALFKRLLHRFLHIATVPGIPEHLPVEDGLRIYLEAEMRFPDVARWEPMGRFFQLHAERIGGLGAAVVARVCRAWLSSLPTMLGDQPMPLRDIMSRVALETARTRQAENAARRYRGSDNGDKLIYATALLGAAERTVDIAGFALEMAERRPPADAALARIEALQSARRAERAAAAPRATTTPRRRPPLPAILMPTSEDLPPWPLGPADRIAGAFRDAVLHGNALTPLMDVEPAVAAEVLLASIIEDNPKREYGRSLRPEGDLGLEHDHESYPTIFWKSPFFPFLQLQPGPALEALKQLLDFVMERWAADAPPGVEIPSISLSLPNGETRRFSGTAQQFGWSQENSTGNGQLFCALDALERWLTLKADSGEDMAPWCDRLLALESSTAILGVLVNLGKYQPGLFKGPLRPLVEIETLYGWDLHRVQHGSFGFDAFTWHRQGEAVLNMARNWVLAPHRRDDLRTVVRELTAADAGFASQVAAAAAAWPVPGDAKRRLEQRILRSEFDPANRKQVVDEETGETVTRLIYPADLQADLIAYQADANAKLEPLTLPHQCEQALAGTANLAEQSARYLAEILPDLSVGLPETSERLPMIAAAAATLIARGGDWYRQSSETALHAEAVIRVIVAHVDALPAGDNYHADEAFRFAAIGALHAALGSAAPEQWDAALATVLTGRGGAAISTLMGRAERHRGQLGPAWYRLNFLLLLFAGLARLSPRYEEDEHAPAWRRWLERLRAQPVFGREASSDIIEPANIARRVERLLERRRARKHPDRPSQLTGKSRRFAGLNTSILEPGYAWLLDHEAVERTALDPENRRLLRQLWEFEAWRMEGEGDGDPLEDDDDDEYDLPSRMGYSILRIAAAFVMAAPDDDPDPLWRSILALGPNGYHAVEQFAAGWFLQLFQPVDTGRFMAVWRAMLDYAFVANWTSKRRWYRGSDMLQKLLGLDSPVPLSQPSGVRERIAELIGFYRRWAQDEMPRDEDGIGHFAHFLTTDAGRDLRLEGVLWLGEALGGAERFERGSIGNNLAEVVDVILTQHASELLARADVRNAMIEIVARLVRAQVVTAMGLQARIAALR